MDAATILRDFTAKGVQLAPTDHGTISITPRSRLTDADRDLLRNHKADVLAELHNMNIMIAPNAQNHRMRMPVVYWHRCAEDWMPCASVSVA